MTTAVIILSVLLGLAVIWIGAMFVEKKNLLKDRDGDYIPDVIEDSVEKAKNAVNTKIKDTKQKIKDKL